MQDELPHSPNEFASLLASDSPLFIVGGQAVNLWALYYHEYTREFEPFVSRDIDILGNRKTLIDIAKNIGVKPSFFSRRPPSNMIGAIVATTPDGHSLLVEVLSSVYGIKNVDLQQHVYTISIGESNVIVQVPGPIALLQAKLANVAELSQTGRQDKHHVKILAKLMPAYFANIYSTVVHGKIKEREMLDLLECLIDVVTSAKGRKVLEELNISGRELFPDLKVSSCGKLHSFMTKRLTRLFPEKT